MEVSEILKHVDHTLLSQGATWSEIEQICKDAQTYHCASVCIPQTYVEQAKEFFGEGEHPAICTVIGFPNGYCATCAKCVEAEYAIENGADEIDMVINIGWVKDRLYQKVEDEINAVKRVCGERILKVIIETCLLTEEEKIALCEIVSRSGADYIKTSTGFAGGGATREDVALMVQNVSNGTRVKAAGGIASLEDAADFLALGADRLGTSRVVKAVKAAEK